MPLDRNSKNGLKVIMTGATGMVGNHVLQLMITNPQVAEIVSVGRSTAPQTSPKLTQIQHDDFLNFDPVCAHFKGVDLCIYCLAAYTSQVASDEAYFRITCDYQAVFTRTLEANSPSATFVLFGASGADPTEQSRILFARAKGRAEAQLGATRFPRKYIFRAGYIHPTSGRGPTGVIYGLMSIIGGPLLRLFPSIGTTDRELAQAMVTTGLSSKHPSQIMEVKDIRDILAKGAI